jgi:hypothetical protein
MQTRSSEEIDLTAHSNTFPADAAAGQKWQRTNPLDRQAVNQKTDALSNLAAIVALSIAFFTLVLLSLSAPVSPTGGPTVAQTFELQQRPIWISTVPYAPRDGLVPDFGQPNFGQSSFVQPEQIRVKP